MIKANYPEGEFSMHEFHTYKRNVVPRPLSPAAAALFPGRSPWSRRSSSNIISLADFF